MIDAAKKTNSPEDRARLARSRLDWEDALKRASTRRVLQEIMDMTMFEGAMPVNGGEGVLAFCAGRRSVGLVIRQGVKSIDPRYLLMMELELAASPEMADAAPDPEPDVDA